MTDSYANLRNSIRVFSTRDTVSFGAWAQLKYEKEFVASALNRSARSFGERALKEGLFEIKEWDDGENNHIIQFRAEVVNPMAKPGHFAAQIDDARRLGMSEAASLVKEIACKYATLSGYGPVQALALNGVADSLLKKSREGLG